MKQFFHPFFKRKNNETSPLKMLRGQETSILYSSARAGSSGAGVITNRLTVPIRGGDDTLLEIAVADVNFFNEFVNVTADTNEVQFTIVYSAGEDGGVSNGADWSITMYLRVAPGVYTHAELIAKLNQNIVTMYASANWGDLWQAGTGPKSTTILPDVGFMVVNLPVSGPEDLVQDFTFTAETLAGGDAKKMAIPRFEAQTKHTAILISAPSNPIHFTSSSEAGTDNMFSMVPHTLFMENTPLSRKLGFSKGDSYPIVRFSSSTTTGGRGAWVVVAEDGDTPRHVKWSSSAILSGDYAVRSHTQNKLTGRHMQVCVEQVRSAQNGTGFLNGFPAGVVLSLPLLEPSDEGSSQLNYGVRNRVYHPIGSRIDEITCAFYIDGVRYEPDPMYPIIVEFNIKAVEAPKTHKDEDTLPPIPGFRGVSSSLDPMVVHKKRRVARQLENI